MPDKQKTPATIHARCEWGYRVRYVGIGCDSNNKINIRRTSIWQFLPVCLLPVLLLLQCLRSNSCSEPGARKNQCANEFIIKIIYFHISFTSFNFGHNSISQASSPTHPPRTEVCVVCERRFIRICIWKCSVASCDTPNLAVILTSLIGFYGVNFLGCEQ